jgi:hypothetical protein
MYNVLHFFTLHVWALTFYICLLEFDLFNILFHLIFEMLQLAPMYHTSRKRDLFITTAVRTFSPSQEIYWTFPKLNFCLLINRY